ncbi:hypothetical protein TYRP_020327 [Tyrophagus putrescentiae]|nr:hypothetical protein TYRP_020327 [Tyrophagus putrescentiae]
MNIEEVVGSNSFSIGIDGYNRCVWMHNKEYKFKNSQRHWNAGDVIGVYVDFVNRSVLFGINNKIIEIDGDPFEDEFVFSILPCHVAASLEQYQQCFFNFDCAIIPKAFLNKLEPINQNFQNVYMCGSTATTGNIAINDDKQKNIIMKSDEATGRSLQTWSSVTEEINLAYGRVLNEGYKGDNRITLNACEQWRNQMESVLKDIRNPEHSYDKYMRKIGEIYRKLKSDAQKPNPEPSPHNQPLMLMPAPVQLGQSNFSLWLNSLMMALSSEGAVQAVAFPLHEEHPHNLIARGRILLTVPVELQGPIEKMKIAYVMLQVLRHKYEKNNELSQSSNANMSRKRALPHPDESDPETSVKQHVEEEDANVDDNRVEGLRGDAVAGEHFEGIGVGVGDGSATVLAATVTWLLKDGTSIIGSLVFATVQCTKMDSYCKRWRLFADLLNDCAIAVDLLSPALFRPLLHPGAMFFRCPSIAGGNCRRSDPSRSDATSKSNNLADVSAKDNSQERMVNLAALAFSLLIIPLVSERPFFIWCLFLLSTATHVYANYRAVRAVRLDVFNANRLAIFFEEMLVGEDFLKWSASQNTSKKTSSLSVASVNSRENVWLLNADRRDRLFSNLQLSYGRRFESNSDLEAEQQQQSDSSQPSSLFHFSDRSQRWYRLTMSHFQKKDNKVSFNLEGRLYVDRSSSESNYLPPEELTSLQLSLLYAIFLLNYCAEECQLKRLKRSSPRLQKIAQLVREGSFEALRLAATTAEATQEELIKTAKLSGWRTSHLLIFELFADEDQKEEEGGDDDVCSEDKDYGEEKEEELKKEDN